MIPFNKPYMSGNELSFIKDAVESGKTSGNGLFTKKVHDWFSKRYGFPKSLLTSSCTDALEMCAIAIDLKAGDEVIVPDYTFVSSANAFVMHGAKIVFADSRKDHPGVDEDKLEGLITENTKAIVVVHYAGVAVNMTKVLQVAKKHNLIVVEDAAQAIDSYYDDGIVSQPLGTFGDFATFSFHDTKNIISGEGGLLVVNNPDYFDLMEIIWEKGTNRNAFFKGEVNKYGWVEKGSSFLASEITAAFLYSQLIDLDSIQSKRLQNWESYKTKLTPLASIDADILPVIPQFATNNAHMFYLKTRSIDERDSFIKYMKSNGIYTVFHYLPLHQSEFIAKTNWEQSHNLNNSIRFAQTLVRLPMFVELTELQIERITNKILKFYERSNAIHSVQS